MRRQNLHTHTVYDDGRDTPRAMALAALDAGLASLGFSGHSPLPYENDWCLTKATMPEYLADVGAVRAEFSGRLAVYSGLEWDALSPVPVGFDYIIGSLHHIAVDGACPSIDDTAAVTREALARYFGGDEHAMVRAYFSQYAAMAACPFVDIVGHFDLITKFCETDGLLAADDPFLLACAREAMETLVRAGKLFEVNTGAMARGYRREPYPSVPLLRTLRGLGGRVLITSDAHSAGTVAYAFRETEALLASLGFQEVWQYGAAGFEPAALAK